MTDQELKALAAQWPFSYEEIKTIHDLLVEHQQTEEVLTYALKMIIPNSPGIDFLISAGRACGEGKLELTLSSKINSNRNGGYALKVDGGIEKIFYSDNAFNALTKKTND